MTFVVDCVTYSHDRTLNDLESDVVRSRAAGISSSRSGESHLVFWSTKRHGPEALRGVLHTKSLFAETCPVTTSTVDGLAGRGYEAFCTSEQVMSRRDNGNASVSPSNRRLCEFFFTSHQFIFLISASGEEGFAVEPGTVAGG